MILTLEVTGSQAGSLATETRKVFEGEGGTIGRMPDNSWVLPDPHVSGRHAVVHFEDGQFLIEDRSSNGTFLNTPNNRLPGGQKQPLRDGDVLYIDLYEIRVSISANATGAQAGSSRAVPPAAATRSPAPPTDPFAGTAAPLDVDHYGAEDEFSSERGGLGVMPAPEPDPMKLLNLEPEPKPKPGPHLKAADLRFDSPDQEIFEPPSPVMPEPAPPRPSEEARGAAPPVPDDYDPFAPVQSQPPPAPPQPPAPKPTPGPIGRTSRPVSPAPPTPKPSPGPDKGTAGRTPGTVEPAPRPDVSAQVPASRSAAQGEASGDLARLLEGAGLAGVEVTPELVEDFGRILRVVVTGLMEVLRAREEIKSEFRMQVTRFKASNNNPLKFSANVDDALERMLVKRNPAYLPPVEAFEDAFADVRYHQVAMLEGVRAAYRHMLTEFSPEQLQEHFARALGKGSFLAAAARLRYWDLYRERFHDMVADEDRNFRMLFGEEFARAYEEQLARLRKTKDDDRR